MSLITSLDLLLKGENRNWFEFMANFLSLVSPLSSNTKFFLTQTPVKEILVDEFLAYLTKKDANKSEIEKAIDFKIAEFSINNAGSCKYCTALDLTFAAHEFASKDIHSYLAETLNNNAHYNKFITKLSLADAVVFTESQQELSRGIMLTKELLAQIPNLENLVVEGVKLDNIEDIMMSCKKLRNIELNNNGLKKLPEVTVAGPLEQFILENNPIREIPKNIFQIKTMKSIFLKKLNLLSLPENLPINDEPSQLKSLIISETRVNNLPSDLLRNNLGIEQLVFDGVHLLLPETQQNWPHLLVNIDTFISFYCPVLLSVAEAVELFKKYDYDCNMVLNHIEIQHLNAELFRKYPRLGDKVTSVDSDPLGGLPIALFQLTSLSYLDLSFQSIRKIPDSIEALKNLKTLKLKYCVYLETLSAMVGGLPLLKELDIVGCVNLKTPPIEIQRRGFNSVISYLRRLRTGSVACKRTKLMLVGHGASGKTSLTNCLLDSMYGNSGRLQPDLTDGISIRNWLVPLDDKSSLNFSVWDFAGQQVYYNTHQFFLTNRSVYLLLWNCRLGVEHGSLEFWLNSITCHAPGCPIFLVGTHIDQVSSYELPFAQLKKSFPNIVDAYFVSCFDGTNVDKLAADIIKKTLEEKYMGEKIPECWLQFEEALSEIKYQKSLMDYNEAEKLGMTCGIFDKVELSQTIQFLHDLGSLLHFNNEFLKNKLIINPQYIVDMMASLVSVNQTTIVNGKLFHRDIAAVWSAYDTSLLGWILKLTERFDLTFPLPESNMHLVPCLLPDTEPSSLTWPVIQKEQTVNKLKKEIIVFYHFDHLPAGLFNRLQVRNYQLSDNKAIWKNGSLLKKNNHLALVQRRLNRIEIKVQGLHPENVLFSIHEVLEVLINESFNGVRYDFSFPCPDCIDNNAIDTEKSMFSSSLVRRAFEMKAAFLQCRQHFHPISLVDLNTRFPTDTANTFDIQFRYSIRDLKHYKSSFKTDIAIIYSNKDAESNETLQPRKVKADLEAKKYHCWFSESPNLIPIDSLLFALKGSNLIIFCMSDNFVQDEHCTRAFNYVKRILNKPYILLVVADGSKWQKSDIGAMVTNEVFIKVNTIDRYKTRLPELLDMVHKRLSDKNSNQREGKAQVFISYCHANSQDAINKGTPMKNEFCLGKFDPRSIKSELEKAGFSSWLDVDQVGAKRTLFEDIVDGIRNSNVVIACVSNEYAESENCMKEFRFSANLKKPILVCLFGSVKANPIWRSGELGIINCLNNKEINFQFENPDAFSDLIAELKKLKVSPDIKEDKKNDINSQLFEAEDGSHVGDNEIIYSELSELVQRRFLRQISAYTDTMTRPFPRLFVLDIVSDAGPVASRAKLTRGTSVDLLSVNTRYCLKVLCEHENCWVSLKRI